MAIGRWISTAMTRSNSLPEQPSCASCLRGEKLFSEGREREEHEVDGQEDYLLGGFSNPPKSYLRKLRALRG